MYHDVIRSGGDLKEIWAHSGTAHKESVKNHAGLDVVGEMHVY